ncbi:MAG: hypothetical protein IJ299_05615 [Oscillospiraceae bacterium]|nr:hypothetical protein [Oscillospiraceae bacterium]
MFSGDFAAGFEEYATDAFPFRDVFRAAKAYTSKYVFNLSDNNGVIIKDGHLSKLDYPLNTPMLDHAAERFGFIYNAYLKNAGANIYFSIVPDKNIFLDTLKIDYGKLVSYMCEKTPYMNYIDVFPLLSLDDFYRTDSHWRQECIGDIAEHLASQMGADISAEYTENVLDVPFYGVYAGQSAMKTKPDTIKYLTNDILDRCTVTSFDTGKPEAAHMYNMEKANGRDPYELFLSGNNALLVVENPNAKETRELVIFRDSYTSSLAPLLVPAYSKITLVDIRYIQSAMLGNFVNFENADVLFLYSSSLLNSSLAMK